jgi:hypothetical protein
MSLHTGRSAPLLAVCLATFVVAAAPHHVEAAESAYRVTGRQVLEGPVRWDYLAVNSARHQVFLTRGDHVDVFDAQSKAVVGAIPHTEGVHGAGRNPTGAQAWTFTLLTVVQ